MNPNQNAAPARVRSLPIEQWHALGLEGSMLPVTISLEGDSMRPLIRRGREKVTILPLNRDLKIGDIVLFKGGPTRYVVHRVRKIRENAVQTLGDNCVNPDPWLPKDAIWGLVIKMERGGRTIPLDTPLMRALGRIWMAAHPARRIYFRFRALAARCYRKIFPENRNGGSANGG